MLGLDLRGLFQPMIDSMILNSMIRIGGNANNFFCGSTEYYQELS